MILSPLLSALQRAARFAEEPLGLVRLVVGVMALMGTFIAVILGVTTEPRALQLVGALWAVYGLVVGFTSGVLEPVIDGLFNVLTNIGLTRAGGGYSAIEALVARGNLAAAAEAYAERARDPRERVDATLRRAKLLAESLASAETAALELDNLRTTGPLSSRDDFKVGLALVELYEHHLGDPGRAMAELRRLIDRHPSARDARRLRTALTELKSQRFDAATPS
ncbi:MAG TPA: hypothetical protein VFU40_11680 [Gemmatimonadales bacterium]|nr:hypothetical protein [Gemmatimonadales bacterium]